jgi:hypothetical protein
MGSSFDDRENQTRWMHCIMENAINGRLVLIGCFAGDVPTRVAVAIEAGEVAARDLQADAVAR